MSGMTETMEVTITLSDGCLTRLACGRSGITAKSSRKKTVQKKETLFAEMRGAHAFSPAATAALDIILAFGERA